MRRPGERAECCSGGELWRRQDGALSTRAHALVAQLQAEARMPRDAAPQEAVSLEVLHLVAFLLEVAAVYAHLVRVRAVSYTHLTLPTNLRV